MLFLLEYSNNISLVLVQILFVLFDDADFQMLTILVSVETLSTDVYRCDVCYYRLVQLATDPSLCILVTKP